MGKVQATSRKMSTRTLMILAGGLTICIGFIATIGLISWMSSKEQKMLAVNNLQLIARTTGQQIQGELSKGLDVAKTLGQNIAALPAAGVKDRGVVDKLMQYTLSQNADFMSMTVVFEPNAYDGRDVEFAGKTGQLPDGRYAWYVDRDNKGQYRMNAAPNFMLPGDGDFYQIPKNTRKDVLIEPYKAPYEGVGLVWITSVATPIIINDKLIAVINSDMSLNAIQKRISLLKPFNGTGYAVLISSDGVVVASPDKENAGKKWNGDSSLKTSGLSEHYDPVLKENAIYAWYPVLVGDSDKPWYFGVVVPVSKVMEAANHEIMWAASLMILSIIIVCAVLGILFSRKVLRPLGGEPIEAAKIALSIAGGNLQSDIKFDKNDKSSLFYALHIMQKQLREFVIQIKDASLTVRQGAEEIAHGNLDLSSRTEQQAASLEETAASMEQISAAIRLNADHSREATEMTSKANSIADRGAKIVGQVVETMAGINESSKKIADITTLINSIAFQTNILALNAAVEAARAGEQGRGFAVVASEVRNLAQRTANAVKDVSSLIEESGMRVSRGVSLVDEAGVSMQEINQAVSSVQYMIEQIVTASDEQARGIAQVTQAVNDIDGSTQHNASLVQVMSAASTSLDSRARQLEQTVAHFN
ncbi:methyl-accepting chemotaxis protein [Pantoea sp. Mb-10]|uniref:methyl-accepting chemotaxis protein n=1 Tax=unclassified Pantoea TaxID=2630326 RepID=UPI001E44B2C9|nr:MULTISPECIES: methyl-accepting chemotaxis protein [unclassified Pantoea]MCE0490865.1 methyl-accepting chemotaxis protein [Pantoea sp. Mb-10]MCE0499977.1 methyl-accepting chemotaxis protein [Pantoea sp. Pb-8]